AHTQGQGQRLLAQGRHEPRARLLPKRTIDEGAQPPLTPPLKGAPVNRQSLTQALHSFGLQAMEHGRDQDHDQTGINAAPQETHRGWSMAPPAALLAATKTKAHCPERTAA